MEFIEPLVKPEDDEPAAPAELSAEPMEIVLPEEEDLSLPTGEIILPDPEAEIPELIIEEPTLF